MQRRGPAVLAALVSLCLTVPATAQRVEMPFPQFPQFGLNGPGAIAQTQFMSGTSSRSISMTVENGVKKVHASDDEVKAYIEEQPDGALTVKVTRQYTRDQLDDLMNEAPEIYMHVKSIPEETDSAEIEITVGITRTYKAESAEALKEQNPEAYDVYARFTIGSDDDLNELRGSPIFAIDEFEAAIRDQERRMREMHEQMMRARDGMLQELQAAPDDIRIHPDSEEDDKDRPSPNDKDA